MRVKEVNPSDHHRGRTAARRRRRHSRRAGCGRPRRAPSGVGGADRAAVGRGVAAAVGKRRTGPRVPAGRGCRSSTFLRPNFFRTSTLRTCRSSSAEEPGRCFSDPGGSAAGRRGRDRTRRRPPATRAAATPPPISRRVPRAGQCGEQGVRSGRSKVITAVPQQRAADGDRHRSAVDRLPTQPVRREPGRTRPILPRRFSPVRVRGGR